MEFFANKFGLINPKQNPKLNTMLYSTNPNAGMACFVLNNDAVPIEGYPVLDGGWMVTVMDPNGKKPKNYYYIKLRTLHQLGSMNVWMYLMLYRIAWLFCNASSWIVDIGCFNATSLQLWSWVLLVAPTIIKSMKWKRKNRGSYGTHEQGYAPIFAQIWH